MPPSLILAEQLGLSAEDLLKKLRLFRQSYNFLHVFLRLTTCKEGILPGSLSYCCKCFPGGFADLGDKLVFHYLHSVFETPIRHLQDSQTRRLPGSEAYMLLPFNLYWHQHTKSKTTNVECMKPDISLLLARAQDSFYHSDFPLLAQLLKLLLKIIGLKSTLTNLNLRIPQVTGPLPLCNKQPVKLHGAQSKIHFT